MYMYFIISGIVTIWEIYSAIGNIKSDGGSQSISYQMSAILGVSMILLFISPILLVWDIISLFMPIPKLKLQIVTVCYKFLKGI